MSKTAYLIRGGLHRSLPRTFFAWFRRCGNQRSPFFKESSLYGKIFFCAHDTHRSLQTVIQTSQRAIPGTPSSRRNNFPIIHS